MSISNVIDPLTRKFFPALIPPVPPPLVPNLNAVLTAGNGAGAQTIQNLNELETQKIYQGNYLQLELGESGDTVLLKGSTPLGSLHVGNGLSIEKLPVGANGLVLKANSAQPLGVEWAVDGTNGITGVSAGTNISIDNTNPLIPAISLSNPLTTGLNMGLVSITDSVSSTGTVGQVLSCGAGATTLWTTLSVSQDLGSVLTTGNSAGLNQINMNNNKIINAQDPTNAQDLVTKNYIDTILSGFMKQVKVERFTANGTFVVPVGATYAVAHIKGGGGGIGTTVAGGAGGNSSVAFVSGTLTATGGAGQQSMSGDNNVGEGRGVPGKNGTGKGGAFTAVQTYGVPGVPITFFANGRVVAQSGEKVVGGANVAFGQSITVTVGLGGTAGTTNPAGRGQPGGSGFVWIEYY